MFSLLLYIHPWLRLLTCFYGANVGVLTSIKYQLIESRSHFVDRYLKNGEITLTNHGM